jgi:molybdate transport system substrate-binding protein
MSTREIKLLSSMATAGLLGALAAEYLRSSGVRVSAEAGGGVAIAKRIREGEPADVVVLAADVIDQLIAASHIVGGSRVDLVRSGIAVAVRAGAPRPDISSEAALKSAVLAAGSISYSTGPSGAYLEKLFSRWGILDAIRPRLLVPPPGTAVGSLVAAGSAALGFQQLSELKSLRGIEILGPLPPEIQSVTVFAGGISSRSDDPAAARGLLAYLASPATEALKQRFGMDAA